MIAIYTAEGIATGDGRTGHGRTIDGKLDVALAFPPEMGGSGNGTNPEQLFAVGFAACYHSALRKTARQAGKNIDDSSVRARVSIGPIDGGGFGLEVCLEVSLPHLTDDEARAVAVQAHQVCPYSNATRGNIDVIITVTGD